MYVSIRDFTVRWVGYESVLDGLNDLGLGGFELYVDRGLKGGEYEDMGEIVSLGFDLSTEEKRRILLEELKSRKLVVCALLVENDFGREDVKPEIEWIVDACRVAPTIEAKVVRINSVMSPKAGVPDDDYVKRTVSCIKEVLKRTNGLGVYLAMENHGVLGNKREFIKAVLDGVSSERMGLTLDTGNFYWSGYPLKKVYEIIGTFAEHVKHTHVKNLSFPPNRREAARAPGEGWPNSAAPIYEGDIDHKKVVNVLRKAGYDGDLTVEDESLGNFPAKERLGVLKKDIELLKGLC
ncbi:MAG: sugar phosphate isomerase/epimerase [Candidatus Brockarchaeota archaeon]|nr:sugar phosphate isomerase/epimerase [Candidatus Brockarchaeota archaeon]